MADNENTFLTANNLYNDVEGEAGKTLDLEQNQHRIFRFARCKAKTISDRSIETPFSFMVGSSFLKLS